MCLAILKPGKLVIPTAHLDEGWKRNPDGAGFAYVKDGKVQISKGYMSLKDFRAGYDRTFDLNQNSPFLIHFRIRTQGDRTPANTHPFPVKGGALIHNGGFSGVGASSSGPSDTALFARKYAEVFSYETLKDNKKEFEDAIGYNKVVMLYDDAKYLILNEKDGIWQDDIWYSNDSFTKFVAMYERQGNNAWEEQYLSRANAARTSGVYMGDW
jgi:hypothetical protein